jgi:predicted transcriptional regulator
VRLLDRSSTSSSSDFWFWTSAVIEAANARAAQALEQHGLSRRDAGSLLGVTRQRASQFASMDRHGTGKRSANKAKSG